MTRKLQMRILPFVMLLYLVSFLDRVNVGFAAFSMNKALGLTHTMFGFGGGVFFIGYIAFQVPSNLMMMRVGARGWIARVVVAWGIVSMASAFVVGPHSFYAMRFLLGIAESGFFPGTLLYLSLWFPARQRAVAIAAFMAAAPLSTAIGSPISGALMELPRIAGLANWQWLYIIEGFPGHCSGIAHVEGADRQSGTGDMARCRRASLALGHADGGTRAEHDPPRQCGRGVGCVARSACAGSGVRLLRDFGRSVCNWILVAAADQAVWVFGAHGRLAECAAGRCGGRGHDGMGPAF